mgnify:CR=1 FL=1|jgi:hypothetical protein
MAPLIRVQAGRQTGDRRRSMRQLHSARAVEVDERDELDEAAQSALPTESALT